jgi:hypothetical protein
LVLSTRRGIGQRISSHRPGEFAVSEEPDLSPQDAPDRKVVGYAHGQTAGPVTRAISASSILAIICLIIQLPWGYIGLLVGLSIFDSSPPTAPPPPPVPFSEILIWRFAMILPSMGAFALGCYSLKGDKTERFRIMGIISLLLSALVVAPTVVGSSVIVEWLPNPGIWFFNWLNRLLG